MATWDEILDQNYNPVNTVRDRHSALMEKRQAENMARMRAANPGYAPGGVVQGNQQGFQQFGPPSVNSNQDDWLSTQFQMANEQLGGFGSPEQQAPPAAVNGGMGNTGGNGGGNGPQGNGPSGTSPNGIGVDTSGFDSAMAAVNGISPATQAMAVGFLGPVLGAPIMGMPTQTEQDAALFGEMNAFESEFGPVDMNATPVDTLGNLAGFMSLSETDIGMAISGASGVGLGPADNSGFGGALGSGISGPAQGPVGNEGPGQSTSGTSSGEGSSTGGESSQGPGPGKGGGSSSGNTGGGGSGGSSGGGGDGGGGDGGSGPSGGER